jgi:hypothetical protein
MKRCPFSQAYCMENECMLWDEQCAILEIRTRLEQIHAANTAIWNQLRELQKEHQPLDESR